MGDYSFRKFVFLTTSANWNAYAYKFPFIQNFLTDCSVDKSYEFSYNKNVDSSLTVYRHVEASGRFSFGRVWSAAWASAAAGWIGISRKKASVRLRSRGLTFLFSSVSVSASHICHPIIIKREDPKAFRIFPFLCSDILDSAATLGCYAENAGRIFCLIPVAVSCCFAHVTLVTSSTKAFSLAEAE